VRDGELANEKSELAAKNKSGDTKDTKDTKKKRIRIEPSRPPRKTRTQIDALIEATPSYLPPKSGEGDKQDLQDWNKTIPLLLDKAMRFGEV
jgi:hypothetical protein